MSYTREIVDLDLQFWLLLLPPWFCCKRKVTVREQDRVITFSFLTQCFHSSFPHLLCICSGLEHDDPEEGREARESLHEWACRVRAHCWVLQGTHPTLIAGDHCSHLDDDASFQLAVYTSVASWHLMMSLVFLLRFPHLFRSPWIRPKMTPSHSLTWSQVWSSFLCLYTLPLQMCL